MFCIIVTVDSFFVYKEEEDRNNKKGEKKEEGKNYSIKVFT